MQTWYYTVKMQMCECYCKLFSKIHATKYMTPTNPAKIVMLISQFFYCNGIYKKYIKIVMSYTLKFSNFILCK